MRAKLPATPLIQGPGDVIRALHHRRPSSTRLSSFSPTLSSWVVEDLALEGGYRSKATTSWQPMTQDWPQARALTLLRRLSMRYWIWVTFPEYNTSMERLRLGICHGRTTRSCFIRRNWRAHGQRPALIYFGLPLLLNPSPLG